jgi:hypothetical protein
MSQRIDFLTNSSTLGATPFREASASRYIVAADGTFGGTSIQLQALGPAGNAMNVGAALTAAGFIDVFVQDGSRLRVNMTGGTPTGIFVTAVSCRA